MTLLTDLVQIEDVDFYTDQQFEVYDRMRAEAPAFYYEPLDLFVLTRMDDVRNVSTNPDVFSNTAGLTLNQLRLAANGATAAFERFNEPEGELVITLDPPRQRALRGLMSPTLTPRYLERFRSSLQGSCRDLVLDPQVASGQPFDFVTRIAGILPLLAAAQLLGVADPDLDRMTEWVAALEELTNTVDASDLEEPGQRFDALKDFLRGEISRKRADPGEDMISLFLRSELDGGPVPEPIVLAHIATLMSNGGTTRLLMTSLAGLLAQHPDLWRKLRADPALLDGAIEECLRFLPPARGFVRTATADTSIGDVVIRRGQRVYLMYPAANRDPEHYTAANVFDPARKQGLNHAAFGFGTHFCLGAGLARMEAKLLFTEILAHYEQIEMTGTPIRYRHTQLNGWATLPVRFVQRTASDKDV